MMGGGRYPERYLAFVEWFNKGEYRKALDPVEDLWFAERDEFYKGLVRLTVGLDQLFHSRVLGGPRYLLASAKELLKKQAPRHMGLDVQAILDYIDTVLARLPEGERLGPEELEALKLPRLKLPFDGP